MARTGYQFVGWSTSASSRQGSGSGPDGLYIAGDTYTVIADDSGNPDYTTHGTGSSTLYAIWAQEYTLTVNPNGGTWNGSTSSQNFNDISGATKIIANPTVTPTYTITYDANSQGASYTPSPSSVSRPFTGWTLTGGGSWNSTNSTYTYGTSAGTLTADYNTTSSSFNLPAISKDGYTCKWAEGSTSGTQYEGNTSRTITTNTTYYAVCEQAGPASFTINSYTWTADVQGNGNLSTANTTCSNLSPGTWSVPTRAQYNDLISTSAGKAAAYNHWGSGSFWSSTKYDVYYYYYFLTVSSATSANTSNSAYNFNTRSIVCVRS